MPLSRIPTELQESLTSTDLPSGSLIQAVRASANEVTINTSTPTNVVARNITTQGNSRLYISFTSDCNADGAGAWKFQGIYVNGVQLTRNISATADSDYQSGVCLVWLTDTLSAGTHTVEIKSWQGAGQSTYNQTGGNGNALVIMEIKS